jgi:hypothetical protein
MTPLPPPGLIAYVLIFKAENDVSLTSKNM